jgi:rhodanese-related sulfurtransferase
MSLLKSNLLARIAAICVIACALGLSVNAIRPDGIPYIRRQLKDQRAFAESKPAKAAQALFITLEDAKKAYDQGDLTMVDARPIEDFRNQHIKGAISLYYEDAANKWNAGLGSVPKDNVIITYCSDPECESAIKLADTLTTAGFTKVSIMLDGIPAWKEAGYPVQSSE